MEASTYLFGDTIQLLTPSVPTQMHLLSCARDWRTAGRPGRRVPVQVGSVVGLVGLMAWTCPHQSWQWPLLGSQVEGSVTSHLDAYLLTHLQLCNGAGSTRPPNRSELLMWRNLSGCPWPEQVGCCGGIRLTSPHSTLPLCRGRCTLAADMGGACHMLPHLVPPLFSQRIGAIF